MKRHIHSVRDLLIPAIDFFYPPFRKVMDLQTFRYAVCGGCNMVLGLLVYSISFKYIFKEETFYFGFYAFKAHVAALFLSFCASFVFGFFVSKYVVFDNSHLKGRVQLFRYLMLCLFTLMLNYILLKVFVESLHIYPIAAQIMTTSIVVLFSFMVQKHYTFKSKKKEEVKS